MKRVVKSIDQCSIAVCLLFWLVGFCGIFDPSTSFGEKSVADEIISLDVTDQPLGEVLEKISDAAGCQFSIDASWEGYPITASFKNEPLYRVLKRIFRDLNNAVIYKSDRTIKIIIYDESAPSGKKAGHSAAIKPAEAAMPQAQFDNEATAPQPEVQVAEDSSSEENVEQPSEEIAESVSEANQAGTENAEDNQEESSEAATEDNKAAIAPEQEENAPEQESNQTEKTQSVPDSSENSEKTENSEESNQN
jgi:hypothetical protein